MGASMGGAVALMVGHEEGSRAPRVMFGRGAPEAGGLFRFSAREETIGEWMT